MEFRIIISSTFACTKPTSIAISNALKRIQTNMSLYSNAIHLYTKHPNPCWVIDNNQNILKDIRYLNSYKGARTINTYDFGQLYTNLHHTDIMQNLSEILHSGKVSPLLLSIKSQLPGVSQEEMV